MASQSAMARVETAWEHKFSSQYHSWTGSKDQYELIPSSITTGGSAHPSLLQWLRKLPIWAAQLKGAPERQERAMASALRHHVFSSLSVAIQVGVADKRRACLNLQPISSAPPLAGTLHHWEVATRTSNNTNPLNEDSDSSN